MTKRYERKSRTKATESAVVPFFLPPYRSGQGSINPEIFSECCPKVSAIEQNSEAKDRQPALCRQDSCSSAEPGPESERQTSVFFELAKHSEAAPTSSVVATISCRIQPCSNKSVGRLKAASCGSKLHRRTEPRKMTSLRNFISSRSLILNKEPINYAKTSSCVSNSEVSIMSNRSLLVPDNITDTSNVYSLPCTQDSKQSQSNDSAAKKTPKGGKLKIADKQRAVYREVLSTNSLLRVEIQAVREQYKLALSRSYTSNSSVFDAGREE